MRNRIVGVRLRGRRPGALARRPLGRGSTLREHPHGHPASESHGRRARNDDNTIGPSHVHPPSGPKCSASPVPDASFSGMPAQTGEGLFDLGDMALHSGNMLRQARLAYKTHGTLNRDKTNVILYPTQYGAQHNDVEWIIGPGRALDPTTHFIIVLDQLGNGLSSSPSNSAPPQDRMRFPTITILDNVTAQHRLVTEGFGIERVALVTGYSMGAEQTFQWAASYPAMVERIAPFCGTAKTTPHNVVFLEGVRAALTTDAAWAEGDYVEPPVRGLRALARVYAGWALSQPFYKRELYRAMDFASLDDFLMGFWERRYLRRDANNLLSMLRTWKLNDLGATPGAGGSHRARVGGNHREGHGHGLRDRLVFHSGRHRGRRGPRGRCQVSSHPVGVGPPRGWRVQSGGQRVHRVGDRNAAGDLTAASARSGRSEIRPVTPQSSSRRMSPGSSTTQTWTGVPARRAS